MPLTLITAVRNGAATLRDCLGSVQRQSIPVEHLVLDGQSTDGTLDILAEHQDSRLTVVSEADKGMYDAMCKGIARARGEVIGILNADDFLAGPRVLERVASAFENPAVEASYGDLLYVRGPASKEAKAALKTDEDPFCLAGERVVRKWRAGSMSARSFHWGWMPPHPTFYVRRSVYERLGKFRLDMGTAADYELMLRFLVKQRIKAAYIPEVLVKMRVGGASNASVQSRLKANWFDRKAWDANGLRPYPWTLWMKPLRKIGQWL